MNSKQALEHIIFEAKAEKPIFSMYYQEFLKPIEQDLDRLEKLENAIDILKDNCIIGPSIFSKTGYEMYVESDITREEYNLLKEVLENDK